jgi:hypothetical protein
VSVYRGAADQNPEVVRRVAVGQTGKVHAGEWVIERPSAVHFGANHGDRPVRILLATLFKTGRPPSIPSRTRSHDARTSRWALFWRMISWAGKLAAVPSDADSSRLSVGVGNQYGDVSLATFALLFGIGLIVHGAFATVAGLRLRAPVAARTRSISTARTAGS